MACVEEAAALAEALGDQRRLGWARAAQTAYYWWRAENERAVETGQRACVVAGTVDDLALQVVTNVYLGEAYQSLGDYARAVECFESNLMLLRGKSAHDRFGQYWLPAVNTRLQLILCLVEYGKFAEAIALGQDAVQLAEESNQWMDHTQASGGLGRAYLDAGHLNEAVAWLDRHLDMNTHHLPAAYAWWNPTRGYAYALMGRVAEGLSLLERAVEWCASRHVLQAHARRLVWLAETHLLANQASKATAAAEQAVAFARDHRERGNEAWALRLHGEIAARADPSDVEQADAHYRQALALAEELEMRPLAAHCHLGLGALYPRMGRREQAQAELATAIDMYRTMEMTFWLERAEGTLAQLVG